MVSPTGAGPSASGRVVPFSRDLARPRRIARSRATGRIVGLVVLLGSLAMLFLSFLFAYAVLRARVPVWPPSGEEPLPVWLPLLSTLAIVSSSVALVAAGRAADPGKRLRAMIASLVLGVSFLVAQSILWWVVWSGGWLPSSGSYHSIFYALTAVHAAHVLPGVATLVVGLVRVWRARHRRAGAWSASSLSSISLYWHFLAVVWVVMFVAIFLV